MRRISNHLKEVPFKIQWIIAGSWFISNSIGFAIADKYGIAISNTIWVLSLTAILTLNKLFRKSN